MEKNLKTKSLCCGILTLSYQLLFIVSRHCPPCLVFLWSILENFKYCMTSHLNTSKGNNQREWKQNKPSLLPTSHNAFVTPMLKLTLISSYQDQWITQGLLGVQIGMTFEFRIFQWLGSGLASCWVLPVDPDIDPRFSAVAGAYPFTDARGNIAVVAPGHEADWTGWVTGSWFWRLQGFLFGCRPWKHFLSWLPPSGRHLIEMFENNCSECLVMGWSAPVSGFIMATAKQASVYAVLQRSCVRMCSAFPLKQKWFWICLHY